MHRSSFQSSRSIVVSRQVVAAGRSATFAVLVATLATAPAACGDASSTVPASAVLDSAGARIVEVPPERLDAPAPITVAPDPHLRVGAVDGEATELLSSPTAVRRLSDGRLFLVEAGGRRARLLDPGGGFLRWIGRIGDGPQEFQRASEGGILPGDTLWVRDAGRQRIVLYRPDGEFHRAVSYELPGGGGMVRWVRFLSDGTIADNSTNLSLQAAMETTGDRFHERVLLHFLDRDGNYVRLAADVPGAEYRMGRQQGSSGQPVVTVQMAEPLFSSLPRMEVDDRGNIWTGTGDGFELDRMDRNGNLVERFRAAAAHVPVTPALVDAYVEASVNRAPEQARAGLRANMADREHAESLPAYERMQADETGLLWVSEYTGHRPGTQAEVWWVVEPGGDVLGRVELPAGLRVLTIGDDEILGVETDDFDVPYLVGYRLERGG